MRMLMLTIGRSNFRILSCTNIDGLAVCISRVVPKQASSPCGAQRSVTALKLQLGTQTVQCLAYVTGELMRSHL